MDSYLPEGQKCLIRYTNPGFFLESWMKKMQKDYEEARRFVVIYIVCIEKLILCFFFILLLFFFL